MHRGTLRRTSLVTLENDLFLVCLPLDKGLKLVVCNSYFCYVRSKR